MPDAADTPVDGTPPAGPTAAIDPGPPAEGAPPAPAEKLFTQKELDRLIRERLARQKDQYADYDEVKAQLEKLQTDRLSEDEKRAKETQQAKEKAARLEQELAEAKAQNRAVLVRAALLAEAAKLHFHNPETAVRLVDGAAVEVDEAGQVTGAREALEALAEREPYLVQSAEPARRAAPNLNPGQPEKPAASPKLTPEQLEIARRTGISPEKYAARLVEVQAQAAAARR